ncbi:hypothetical protein [Novosphingobium mangrovi (ex Hu et al. 2023)]|uniref:Right handed beta helix domain-containing protein n=1 Tax=Novosphingobium mangrovi (ex Hu et al. 2023) TaxID=2930094 RepID=A0ABT0AC93_9SPHN|nr:hypothetical protein [Novosphingobium mangrovi (ex Hu et al. 2023)]MCJ1960779.1 hypothetical protein [Novosphingobium mangrovi (ex Hu et al. 2023)]
MGPCHDIVFNDLIFESTLSATSRNLYGLIHCGNNDLERITFNRCRFTAPQAYVNALKFVFDDAPNGGFDIVFNDCVIDGVGRMGIEVQNHGVGTAERYGRIRWRGGKVVNTGLLGQVSFQGGSVQVSAGQTIVGASSASTAVVKAVVLSSGTWEAGDATGYFVVEDWASQFANAETIEANGVVAATCTGFNGNGQAFSFSGYGLDGEISNCQIENAAYAGIENVGLSHLTVANVTARDLVRGGGGCRPIAYTHERPMRGGNVTNFQCLTPASGPVTFANQIDLRTSHNLFNCSQVIYRGSRNAKSVQDAYICSSGPALFCTLAANEGLYTDYNTWTDLDIDHSAAATPFAMVRFQGANTQGNRIKGLRFKAASGGAFADNDAGSGPAAGLASNNFIVGLVEDYNGQGRPAPTLTFPSDTSYDVSTLSSWPALTAAPYVTIAGALSATRELRIPNNIPGRLALLNTATSPVSVKRTAGGAAALVHTAATAAVTRSGNDMVLVG